MASGDSSKTKKRSSQTKVNASDGSVANASRDKRSGLVVPGGYSPSHKRASKDPHHGWLIAVNPFSSIDCSFTRHLLHIILSCARCTRSYVLARGNSVRWTMVLACDAR